MTPHSETGTRLTLYYRQDCHLCEVMLQALRGLQRTLRFELDLVDIDRNPALVATYQERVPVLCKGQQEVCHYQLDEPRLRRELER